MSTQPKPSDKPRKTSAERTRAYRERLRAQGLKPRTIWTVDVDDPGFLERLKADAQKLKKDPEETAILKEIEQLYSWDDLD